MRSSLADRSEAIVAALKGAVAGDRGMTAPLGPRNAAVVALQKSWPAPIAGSRARPGA